MHCNATCHLIWATITRGPKFTQTCIKKKLTNLATDFDWEQQRLLPLRHRGEGGASPVGRERDEKEGGAADEGECQQGGGQLVSFTADILL